MSFRKNFLNMVIVGFILSVFVTDVMGEEVKVPDQSTKGGVLLYDKDSIKRSGGKVEVWVKTIYGKEKIGGVEEMLKYSNDPTKGVEYISYNKTLYEINCEEETFHRLTSIYYDQNGVVISTNNQATKFKCISSGSTIDRIRKIVCK